MRRLILAPLLLLGLLLCGAGHAQSTVGIVRADESVTVCTASDLQRPPAPNASCRQMSLIDVPLSGRAVWVRATIDLPGALLEKRGPLGLFVSARASTRVYVNGVHVGSNGRPALTGSDEVAGTLDAVFHPPAGTLRPGRNEVLLLASAHRPYVVDSQALHSILLAPYRPPSFMTLPRYLPALLTFGAFLVGAIYFGAMAITRRGDRASLALGAASLFVTCQLAIEAVRAVWTYPYPFHGVRLALILFFSLCVGLTLTLHTAERLRPDRARSVLVAVTLLATGGALFAPGFDAKLDWVALVTSLGSSTIAFLALRQGREGAGQYLAAFLALPILVLLDPVNFFDRHAFWAFAILLAFLFVREALALRQAEREREEAEGRRRQLEAALDRLSSPSPASIIATGSGRQQRVTTDEIAVLCGAGDYVEVRLADGRELLHAGSLAALEKDLPPAFLRVHRSHIVNLDQIAELVRHPSGGGELRLRNGGMVPVSRRVMPRVRRAFTDGDRGGRSPAGSAG